MMDDVFILIRVVASIDMFRSDKASPSGYFDKINN